MNDIVLGLLLLFAYATLLFCLNLLSSKSKFPAFLSSGKASLGITAVFLIFIIILGLVPQDINAQGIHNFKNSIAFKTIYVLFVTVLGLVCFRRLKSDIRKPNLRKLSFLCMHWGLFIALTGAALGSLQLERYKILCVSNQAEWRAFSEKGESTELPFALKMIRFEMEEYSPKISIFDLRKKSYIPLKHPQYLQIDSERLKFKGLKAQEKQIGKWTIGVLEYIPALKEGDAPAAWVRLDNSKGDSLGEYRISSGSFLLEPEYVYLDSIHILSMGRPEPKQFKATYLLMRMKNGNPQTDTIHLQVNRPYRLGSRSLYLQSYDTDQGKHSRYTIVESVKDSWLWLTYTGIIMLFAGCLLILFKKEDRI